MLEQPTIEEEVREAKRNLEDLDEASLKSFCDLEGEGCDHELGWELDHPRLRVRCTMNGS